MTTVFTNGCFDIIHAGHVHFLDQAKALGDYLIVGINTDESVRALKGPNRPINRLTHRIEVLSALRAVDEVHSFGSEEELEALIKGFSPDVLVKAGYAREQITGAHLCERVVILDIVPGISTTEIIDKIVARR